MCMYVSTTINSCVKYTFLIRTTGAIVIVLAVEIAFQCGINLADVLGPYGALAGSAAVFMCTLIDFAVLWESKASVVSVKSLPNK
ncbi:hypothetical protein QR680_010250 [Steinernema hermaphroditum]|uniref:Uncharacterized protein n=1 Tax=Steinernema hermaphroditum TaxID=289476 RepID=A0AA39IQS1_9BILA|nr:hypothetical protein QR680_010250 [Steinernema hermaphroditum]